MLYLEQGVVVHPVQEGFAPLRGEDGSVLDPFDVSDRLIAKYHRFYFVDLDGLRTNQPQLDYLQELSHGHEVWAEAGPRNAEQVIDIMVAGATKVVLSLELLDQPETEIAHTLLLTPEIALLLNANQTGVLSADEDLRGRPLPEVGRRALEWGVPTLVLPDAREGWETVSALAQLTSLYVKGVRPEEMESLRASGAAGAIFEVPDRE